MSVLPRRRGVIRVVAAAASVLLAAGAAGCGGEPEIEWPDVTPASRPVPAPETPTLSPAEAEAAAEILELVNGFREVEVASYADPQPPHLARLDLTDYLADPLLSRTLGTLSTMDEAGIVFEGRPTWDPAVHELRLDETPPTATVRDCVDASNWRDVFRETGDRVPGDPRPDRYVEWLDLTLYPDGWLIHAAGAQEDPEC